MVKALAVGERVRVLRVERDLTQADLAARARVDVSTLSRIELNKQSPTIETVEDLALALGVRPGDLLGLGEPDVDYSLTEDPEIRIPLAEYLSSARGRSARAEVVARISQPALYRALGIAKPAWDDFDDVRRLLERHVR